MKRKQPSTRLTADHIQRNLPRLLKEEPHFRHEIVGILAEVFPTRHEVGEIVVELRALREDFNRHAEATDRRFEELNQRFEGFNQRFEEINQRFEAMERRFEEINHRFEEVNRRFEKMDLRFNEMVIELRSLRINVGALGGRLGRGLEHLVRGVVEEFSGQALIRAERLILKDTAGEVFGVPNADVEFDLYACNGEAYLVEVKSHIETDDVLSFYRKANFAATHLDRPFTRMMIASSMHKKAEDLLKSLGIKYIVHVAIED